MWYPCGTHMGMILCNPTLSLHKNLNEKIMQGNFIMLQMDDLKQVVTEIVEKVCARRRLSEKPSKGDGDWLTREEVCDMLHITYTTLWRKENDGVIQKHKIGRRNLYNKTEVEALLSSGVDIAVTHKK